METQGELLEAVQVISSQAKAPKEALEGSEIRGTAKAMIPPRAPCSSVEDGDMIRYPRRKVGSTSKQRTQQLPAHGNVIAQETINGTMHLLRILERAMFRGDSSLSALQFDGWEKLITDNAPAANIIDLRGAPLSEDNLTDGALTVQDAPNYGQMEGRPVA